MSAFPILELRRVGKRYEDGPRSVTVLDRVDLSVRSGDVIWIDGASGSGKTSLLNVAGLLTLPSSGVVLHDHRDMTAAHDVTRTASRAEDVGMVFQSHNLFPELTSVENVMMAARDASRLAAAESALSDMGLTECLHVRAKKLSGGQQQRVAVVRAMINGPALILADEPVSGLDEENAARVLSALEEAARRGSAVIISSHDPSVEAIATTHARLSRGLLTRVSEEPPGR